LKGTDGIVRKIILLCLLFVVPTACGVSAQGPPTVDSKKADISQLLALTSAAAFKPVWDLAVKDVTESLKLAVPDLSPEAIAAARDETLIVLREHNQDFEVRMYSVYDRLFSPEEIKELLQFYKSPLGQKVIQAMPILTKEAAEAGKEMGKTLYPTITQRVLARLKKEGFWKP
jgi:uncharacterized protein